MIVEGRDVLMQGIQPKVIQGRHYKRGEVESTKSDTSRQKNSELGRRLVMESERGVRNNKIGL